MEAVRLPYIRCVECQHRAFLDKEWPPGRGIAPLMRKWTCNAGHDTYWDMQTKDIARLATATPGVSPERTALETP